MRTQKIANFTDKRIQSYKPDIGRYDVSEVNGLGLNLRVHPSGIKSWVYIYSFNDGRKRRTRVMTLGNYPHMGLAEAREEHAKARRMRKDGIDPAAKQLNEKRQRIRAEYEADTVAELIHEYIRKCEREVRNGKRKESSLREDKRILIGTDKSKFKSILDTWGKLKAKDITRRDVKNLLDDIDNKRSPHQADNIKARLTAVFNYGVKEEIITATPCTNLENYASKSPRTRTLSNDEIKLFWINVDNIKAEPMIKLALKLLLLTGLRRGELAMAERKEFDLEKGEWLIPGEHTKNKLPHLVPLSPTAIDLVKRMFKTGGDSKFLMPNRYKDDEAPMQPAATSHAIRNNRNVFEIDDFSPHDLRRTMTTKMIGDLKIQEKHVEKVLNHQPNKKRAIVNYNHYEYFEEKQNALNAWANYINSILEENDDKQDNVVSMVR